jgi:hypothetical protein
VSDKVENNLIIQKIKIISIIVLIGLISSILFHYVFQINSGYPNNTFLFLPSDRFNDFYGVAEAESIKNFNPYFNQSYSDTGLYLPLGYYFIWIFSIFKIPISLVVYLCLATAIFVFLIYKMLPNVSQNFKFIAIVSILFLSYGYIYAIDRANVELYLAGSILAFFYFYSKGKIHLSIVFIALAAASKIYPILFILIPISDKKYKEAIYCIFYTILIAIIPLFFLKGGFINNLNYILTGFEIKDVSVYSDNVYKGTSEFLQPGLSLFSVLKIFNIKFGFNIWNLFNYYKIIVVVIAIFSALYVTLIPTNLWKKAFIITANILILPHISFDYKLLLILPSLILFLKDEWDNKKFTYIITILFGLLLIPKAYYYLEFFKSPATGIHDISISTILNPILICSIFTLIIVVDFFSLKWQLIKSGVSEHFIEFKRNLRIIFLSLVFLTPLFFQFLHANKNYLKYRNYIDSSEKNIENKNLDSAIYNLKQASKLKPYKFKLHRKLGDLYFIKKNWILSIINYNEALKLFPGCLEAKNGILKSKINLCFEAALSHNNSNKFNADSKELSKAIYFTEKLRKTEKDTTNLISIYVKLIDLSKYKRNNAFVIKCKEQLNIIDPKNKFLKENSNLDKQVSND